MFPHTESRRLRLDPATSDTARDTMLGTLLRTGIESLRPSAGAGGLMDNSCAAFLVRRRSSGDVLGFSVLHGLSPAGHVKCGLYLDPEKTRLGVGAEAAHLTYNYAFATFDISKVIVQTTEASFASFGLTEGAPRKTAVLGNHLYFRGRYWDLHTYEVHRAEWEDRVRRNLDDGLLADSLSWRIAPA
ncbi:GNAT family N-acetyltransferase [Streptomyces sp. NPDC098781]|uniref:GNAT family N-acetyltransferase n=1 Tax=Streptomyces sp. NPDC098781 TaxID=3366097 RepID=UPI00380D6907